MKSCHYHYTSTESLIDWLSLVYDPSHESLFQVFSSELDPLRIQEPLSVLATYCPKAKVIGATSAGNIAMSEIFDEGILISLTCFEYTQIQVHYFENTDSHAGADAAHRALAAKTRCAIAFGNVLTGTPHLFLSSFGDMAPHILVAGGNAGDLGKFERSYVFIGDKLHTQGLVMAWLIGDRLRVENDYWLNWMPVGRPMQITKLVDNTIYELDQQPVLDVYQKYLGPTVLTQIPQSMMQFPLIRIVDRVKVARAAIAQTSDNGVMFAGDFVEGESVRFGILDQSSLHDERLKDIERLAKKTSIESLFIYSCVARRQFMGEEMLAELSTVNTLAAAVGLFTYGEYFHGQQQNATLNITSTFLALSESEVVTTPQQTVKVAASQSLNITKALVQLVNVTAKELTITQQLLDQYQLALDKGSIVSKADVHGRITYINEQFEKISGYRQDEVLGKNHNILRHPDMPNQVFKDLWRTITHKQAWRGIIKNRRKDGSSYTVNSIIVPILDDEGEIVEYISIRQDITELLAHQAQINEHLIDRLTNLPTRNALIDDMKIVDFDFLALCDVRNFKSFNNFYGIDTADRLLKEIATWLQHFGEQHHLKVYRLFGDRFAIAPYISKETSILRYQRLNGALEDFKQALSQLWLEIETEVFMIEQTNINIDVVIGIGMESQHLLTLAELAVDANKAEGKAAQREPLVFDEKSLKHYEHLKWINKIKEALAANRIVNFYQPIVDSKNINARKYEALVRMIEVNGDVISPFLFLDIIKKTRYYAQITQRVFDQALAFAKEKRVQVSINLSIEDIENKLLREYLLSQLTQDVGKYIIFEITESESIQDFTQVFDFIQAVHAVGTSIAIDDFGAGYSNFSYLVEMKADYIKIDGAIIKNILNDKNSQLVAESIIDIARKLGMKVVAEFVSDADLAEKLIGMNVDFLQGYYYGAPKPEGELDNEP